MVASAVICQCHSANRSRLTVHRSSFYWFCHSTFVVRCVRRNIDQFTNNVPRPSVACASGLRVNDTAQNFANVTGMIRPPRITVLDRAQRSI
jgi:hypothetical protein